VSDLSMMNSMIEYYERRAQEYDAIYDRAQVKSDLRELGRWLQDHVRDLTVLEVACGTGYWTSIAAASARSILATDYNPGPLAIARAKGLGANVRLERADAYALPDYPLHFECGMAHLWWSHVCKRDQAAFLSQFASKLLPGAKLLMIDNNFVSGSTAISRVDDDGNSYQLRSLRNGEQYEVLKNFPSAEDLERVLGSFCSDVRIRELEYFWAVSASFPDASRFNARRN